MKRVIVFGILLISCRPVLAQEDSLVVLSPRVGRFIDNLEREYFNFLKGLPDSEQVYLVRRTAEGKETVILTSIHGTQKSLVVDTASMAHYANQIEWREKGANRESGRVVTVKLRSSEKRRGEVLFADIHGLVLAEEMRSPIPRGEIVSIETDDHFGQAVATGMSAGTLVGVAVYGGSAVGGTDLAAEYGVFGTLLFASAGMLVGLLLEAIIASAPGTGKLIDEGEEWDSSVVEGILAAARFPAGTPELKLALAALDKD